MGFTDIHLSIELKYAQLNFFLIFNNTNSERKNTKQVCNIEKFSKCGFKKIIVIPVFCLKQTQRVYRYKSLLFESG